MARSRSPVILLQGLALAGFVVSLSLPAFLFDGFPPDMSGLDVLLSGWLGLVILDPRWYANVLFAICLVASVLGFPLRKTAIAGLLLVGASLVLPITYFPNDRGELVERLGAGVYVWAAALGVAFASNLWLLRLPSTAAIVASGSRARVLRGLAVVGALAMAVVAFFLVKPRLFAEQTAYAEGCRGAFVRIFERIPTQTVVAFVPDEFPSYGSSLGTHWGPLGEFLVARTELERVERPPTAAHDRPLVHTPFETLAVDGPVIADWSPGKPSTKYAIQPLAAQTATYEVVTTNLAPRGYDSPHHGGADIVVRERANPARVVAHAHYYWLEDGSAGCPKEAARGDFARRFIEQALGLHERDH